MNHGPTPKPKPAQPNSTKGLSSYLYDLVFLFSLHVNSARVPGVGLHGRLSGYCDGTPRARTTPLHGPARSPVVGNPYFSSVGLSVFPATFSTPLKVSPVLLYVLTPLVTPYGSFGPPTVTPVKQ